MLERIFVVVEIEIDTNFPFPTGNDVENSSDVFVSASVSIKNCFVEKFYCEICKSATHCEKLHRERRNKDDSRLQT